MSVSWWLYKVTTGENNMGFTCKTYIVDSLMGTGKTSAIINMVKAAPKTEKFLIITPYLDEVKRYIDSCPDEKFKQPRFDRIKHEGDEEDEFIPKYEDVKRLLERGENVVCTHALFHKFTEETVSFCKSYGYTLIMDEVASVIEEWTTTEDDYNNLINTYVTIDEKTRRVSWKEEYSDYTGVFDKYKIACDNGSLASFSNRFMVWLFPVGVFNAFEKVFILTYKFEAQLQKYYYDFYDLKYKYLSVEGDSPDNYRIVEQHNNPPKYDYAKLIHILDNDRMNAIGEIRSALSKTWYDRRKDDGNVMGLIKNNLWNFFTNIRHGATKDNLWTVFKDNKQKLKGKGYTKGFCPMNMRATNDFRERTNVAYIINRYMQPYLKNFFTTANIEVNEEEWALTEMLQFIWRSAVRDGKEIYLYIPSSRMRDILTEWIAEVSAEYNSNIAR